MPFHNGIAFIFPNFTPSNNKKYIGRYLIGKRKETYHFLSFFLPAVFLIYLGSTTLFYHTHVINGVIIVHSHINTGEHTHSKQSLETIFFLSNILTFGGFQSSFVPVLWLYFIRVILFPALSCIIVTTRGTISLRAPPALF